MLCTCTGISLNLDFTGWEFDFDQKILWGERYAFITYLKVFPAHHFDIWGPHLNCFRYQKVFRSNSISPPNDISISEIAGHDHSTLQQSGTLLCCILRKSFEDHPEDFLWVSDYCYTVQPLCVSPHKHLINRKFVRERNRAITNQGNARFPCVSRTFIFLLLAKGVMIQDRNQYGNQNFRWSVLIKAISNSLYNMFPR